MGQAYPELTARQDYVAQVIQAEEERFMRTLKDGLSRLDKIFAEPKTASSKRISGTDAFVLGDTYGFPVDLTAILAEEKGFSVDMDGYRVALEEQRERARGAAKFDGALASDEGWTILDKSAGTRFVGYEQLTCQARVRRYREVGDHILVCLDQSPFYAESGGQVGDSGTLVAKVGDKALELRVEDTFKILELHVHKCSLINGLVGKDIMAAPFTATVDANARAATVRNHSATHLLHAALKSVLGPHVQQQGSRVAPEGLRFDFTQPKALSPEEVAKVETLVNEQVLSNLGVRIEEKGLDEAKKAGAVALFGEKYGDRVRTIKMGEFSFELCGGTHANATGQIGLFRITGESSIAAGIRRIEGVTGLTALDMSRRQSSTLLGVSRALKVKPEELEGKVNDMAEKLKSYEKELTKFKTEQINLKIDEMLTRDVKEQGGVRCIVKKIDAAVFPRAALQTLLDSLAAKLGNGVAVLTQVEDGQLMILAAVGDGARAKMKAGDLVKELGAHADGRGGGRPDKAQAGSKFPEKEELVLSEARKLLGKLTGA
jgi:alanyl-tRNA synthetase